MQKNIIKMFKIFIIFKPLIFQKHTEKSVIKQNNWGTIALSKMTKNMFMLYTVLHSCMHVNVKLTLIYIHTYTNTHLGGVINNGDKMKRCKMKSLEKNI